MRRREMRRRVTHSMTWAAETQPNPCERAGPVTEPRAGCALGADPPSPASASAPPEAVTVGNCEPQRHALLPWCAVEAAVSARAAQLLMPVRAPLALMWCLRRCRASPACCGPCTRMQAVTRMAERG